MHVSECRRAWRDFKWQGKEEERERERGNKGITVYLCVFLSYSICLRYDVCVCLCCAYVHGSVSK